MAGGGGSPCLYLLIFLMADLGWLILCVCGGVCKTFELCTTHSISTLSSPHPATDIPEPDKSASFSFAFFYLPLNGGESKMVIYKSPHQL
jgi:hypothetical protein